MSQPDQNKYLTPVTVNYLKGKKNGRLYPANADKSMLEFAIAQQGGPRQCRNCDTPFIATYTGLTICPDCKASKQTEKYLSSEQEAPGDIIMSLISGNFRTCIDDFTEEARDEDDSEENLTDDQVILRCLLVNPTPNQPILIEWENISADIQPEEDWAEPSEEVADAIEKLNQALTKMKPISYGPQWETRLPYSSPTNKKNHG